MEFNSNFNLFGYEKAKRAIRDLASESMKFRKEAGGVIESNIGIIGYEAGQQQVLKSKIAEKNKQISVLPPAAFETPAGEKLLKDYQNLNIELIKSKSTTQDLTSQTKNLMSALSSGTGKATTDFQRLTSAQLLLKEGMAGFKPATTLAEAVYYAGKLGKKYEEINVAIRAVRKEENRLKGLGLAGARTEPSLKMWQRTEERLLEQRTILGREIANNQKSINTFHTQAVSGGNSWLRNMAMQQKYIQDIGSRIGIAIQKIVTYRLAFGAWQQTVQQLRSVYDETVKIDDAMQELKKVMQATDPVYKRLEQSAFNFGLKYGRSVFEVTEGFITFAQQGLSTDEILNRMNSTLLAVSGSTMTTTQAVEALTAVVKNYPEFQTNLTAAVDKWTRVAAIAPVTAQDLAEGIFKVGTTASEVGVDLDHLNGIIAAVAEVTRESGSAIGTSLKTMFGRFPREESIKAFQDLGVLALKDAGTLRSFSNVLEDLHNNWNKITDIQKKHFAEVMGGLRRYNDFLALMKNYDAYVRAVAEGQMSFNFAEKASIAETDKLKRQIQMVATNFERLKVAVGEGGAVTELVKFLHNINLLTTSAVYHGSSISSLIVSYAKWGTGISTIFLGVTLLTALMQKLTRAIYLNATAEVLASKTAFKLAASIRFLNQAFGLVSIAIMAIVGIYTLFKASSDKAAIKTDNLNRALDEQQQKLTQLAREQAAAKGPKFLEQFEQLQQLNDINKDIKNFSEELYKLDEIQTKLSSSPELKWKFGYMSGIGWSFFRVPIEGSEKLALANQFLEQSYASLDKAIAEINRKKNLNKLYIAEYEVLKLYKTGKASIDDYKQAMKERMAFPIQNMLDDALETESRLTKIKSELKKGVGVSEWSLEAALGQNKVKAEDLIPPDLGRKIGIILSRYGYERFTPQTYEGLNKLMRLLDSQIRLATQDLDNLENAMKKGLNPDAVYEMIDRFSKMDAEIKKSDFELNAMGKRIGERISDAKRFGREFSGLGYRIETVDKQIDHLVEMRDAPLLDKIEKRLQLTKNGLTPIADLIDRSTATDAEDIRLIASIEEALQNIKATSGLSYEQMLEYAKLYASVVIDYRINERTLNDALEERKKILEGLLDSYYKIYERQLKIKSDYEFQNLLLQRQADWIKDTGKGFGRIENTSAFTLEFMKKIVMEEQEILGLKLQQAKNDVESARIQDELINDSQSRKTLLEAQNRLAETQNQNYIDNLRLADQVFIHYLANIKNIKNSLASAFVGFTANIPLNLVSRKEELDNLKREEHNAINELNKARVSGDKNATIQALNNLKTIHYEMEKLGTISIFEPLLEQLSSIRMEELARQFIGNITSGGLGNILANGITTGSIQGAQEFERRIKFAGMEVGDYLRQSILFAISEGGELPTPILGDTEAEIVKLSEVLRTGVNKFGYVLTNDEMKVVEHYRNSLVQGSIKGSNYFEQALVAGSIMGGQVLAQSLFGGGKYASLGANLGSIFGQAAGKQWLTGTFLGSFGGPVGALMGSLLGAWLGSTQDKQLNLLDENTTELSRNTQEIRNNNELLSLQREFINAPTRYVPPPAKGNYGGGINPLSIYVNVNGGSPTVGEDVVKAIEDAYGTGKRLIGAKSRRFE